jgi:hypothetical protein
MSNATVTPGSSRANKQQHNNMAVANATMPLFKGYSDWLQSMQPTMLQGYGNLYNLGSQKNTESIVDAMTRHSLMNGMAAQRAAMNMYGNSSLAQGDGINAMNRGIDAANAFRGQQFDPSTMMSHLAAALSAMQAPMQNMQSYASTIYGQPQVPTGPSPLQDVLSVAQTAGGLGWQPFKAKSPRPPMGGMPAQGNGPVYV